MFIRSVAEVVESRPVPQIAPHATVREASHVLDAHDIGALVVIDAGRVTGLLSERDVLRRCIGQDLSPDHTRVADVMTPAPKCVAPGDGLADAIRLMEDGHFRHLPVVDAAGTCMGLLSIRDIPTEYRMMVERFREMRGGA